VGNVLDAINRHHAERKAGTPAQEQASSAELRPAVADRGAEPPWPAAGTDNYSSVLVAHHKRAGRITDQYRSLRAHLLARYPDERFCIMVTSAEAGEGKTVTCLNLAFVLAGRRECRTIVMDCDLRKNKIASLLRAGSGPGVADVLRGTARLEEAMKPTVHPNLFFITAGHAGRGEAGELVGRPELQDITTQLRRHHDYVLLDTPPINSVSDASMLGQAVDEALLIVRMNRTRRESVDKAIKLLDAVNVKLAGLVLTHQKYYIPNYLYRYS